MTVVLLLTDESSTPLPLLFRAATQTSLLCSVLLCPDLLQLLTLSTPPFRFQRHPPNHQQFSLQTGTIIQLKVLKWWRQQEKTDCPILIKL